MVVHQKNSCRNISSESPSNSSTHEDKILRLEKQVAKLIGDKHKTDEEINLLKNKPSVNNQILQVVCVSNNDNYLDMLTNEWNNFDKALGYIKDCALSSLTGDCKLIKKIYFDEKDEPGIRFLNKTRTNVEYYDENRVKMNDSKEIFGRKLANNLQNTYLKGVNYLILSNLENRQCPNKLLEDYDLQTWNQHIYDLSDSQYHKKIINQLNIPLNI